MAEIVVDQAIPRPQPGCVKLLMVTEDGHYAHTDVSYQAIGNDSRLWEIVGDELLFAIQSQSALPEQPRL